MRYIIPAVVAISCYKCESYRDFRCLDPFDQRPHIQVNCDFEPFVRDRKPVFCEKTTELSENIGRCVSEMSPCLWLETDASDEKWPLKPRSGPPRQRAAARSTLACA